ncbi:hypothetical protein RRG08_039846 [Elysia crispata]|uniref:Uncharacterized protein n=1 Tax=Elysia crispata TaxID=231223 RepID=A0AAE0ZWE8_9GAST|nr:hypothetical protein RRG08_039846 [Elysia crispata]
MATMAFLHGCPIPLDSGSRSKRRKSGKCHLTHAQFNVRQSTPAGKITKTNGGEEPLPFCIGISALTQYRQKSFSDYLVRHLHLHPQEVVF